MTKKYLILLVILKVTFINICISQNYIIQNNNVDFKVEINNDSALINLKNNTDKSFLLPSDKLLIIKYNKSGGIDIDFGVDLKDFNESFYELQILKPGKTILIKSKININETINHFHFIYHFYTRKINNKKGNKTFYNSDFINQKKWLKKGDWIWGEFFISQ